LVLDRDKKIASNAREFEQIELYGTKKVQT
jgi:hypothetical protein